jgi:hypothetical protein
MKKIFTFNQRLMNGTVTMQSQVACFTSRELAEKVKQAVLEANYYNCEEMNGTYCLCDEIVETDVYESEQAVPILNK